MQGQIAQAALAWTYRTNKQKWKDLFLLWLQPVWRIGSPRCDLWITDDAIDVIIWVRNSNKRNETKRNETKNNNNNNNNNNNKKRLWNILVFPFISIPGVTVLFPA